MPEIIAQAMHAVLPGVDANDSAKCLTVINFLSILLSCLPQLPVRPCFSAPLLLVLLLLLLLLLSNSACKIWHLTTALCQLHF